MIAGFEKGGEMVKAKSPSETIAAFDAMGKGEAQTARIGARQALTELIEKGSGSALRRFETDKGLGRVMEAMFGKDEAAEIQRAASLRLQRLNNAARASGGAPPPRDTAMGLAHTPKGAAAYQVMHAVRAGLTGIGRDEGEQIARIGTSESGAALRKIAPKAGRKTGRAGRLGARAAAQADYEAEGYQR